MALQLRKVSMASAASNPLLWQPIPSLVGRYVANEKGFILNTATQRIITNTTYSNGYVYVSVATPNGVKNKRLHRLIAEAFIPNPFGKPQVNHCSGNKGNNHVANLEWATSTENIQHAFDTGLNKGSKPWLGKRNTPRSRPVRQLSLQGELIMAWPSVAEAARNGFTTANIIKVCKGERPAHKGFIWTY